MSWKEAILSGPGPKNIKEALVLYIKGVCMGIADLIPGVSGGTIAFISGIYGELLEAVAAINGELFKKIFSLKWKAGLDQLHFRFLVPLGLGIMTSIFSLAHFMHYLMEVHPVPTWAAFLGLIAASILVIWRDLKDPLRPKGLAILLLGALVGYAVVSLIPVNTPEQLWFIFLCGIIGITAMILPGLSGSFLLLILGKYEYITGALKSPFDQGNFIVLVVFSFGTLAGLVSFSKFLNYLMKRYYNETMYFLTGLLIGTLKKVWPWKETLETTIIRGKVRVLREANIFPEDFSGPTILAITLIVIGFILVLVMESKVKEKNKTAVN